MARARPERTAAAAPRVGGSYDDHVDFALAIAIILLALMVSATPALGIPVGVVLGVYVLVADESVWLAAALGAAGVALGRLWLAVAARAGRRSRRNPVARSHVEAVRQALTSNGRYRRAVFWAAATPLVPARFLWPLLGTIRAPLAPALAGVVLGQLPLLALTCGIAVAVARALTQGEDEAATLLGLAAILMMMFRLLGSIDWDHWRAHRRLRMRPSGHGSRVSTFFGAPKGPGAGRVRTGVFGLPADAVDSPHADDDVLDLEPIDHDGGTEGPDAGRAAGTGSDDEARS